MIPEMSNFTSPPVYPGVYHGSIKRRNLEDEAIADAIVWARNRGIESCAEIIFGLPEETRTSFLETLKRAYSRKFDSIHVVNLLIFNGSVLNRTIERKQHGTVTRFRSQGSSCMDIEGNFAAETSEVVISSNSFSFEDYLALRPLSFIIFAIGAPGFYRLFFRGLQSLEIDIFAFFENFLAPSSDHSWPHEYLLFLSDLNQAFRSELYESSHVLKEELKKKYYRDGGKVTAATKLNVLFAARLIFSEQMWHREVFSKHLEILGVDPTKSEMWEIVEELMAICKNERIDLRNIQEPKGFPAKYDIISWQKHGFKKPLQQYKMSKLKKLSFRLSSETVTSIEKFDESFGELSDQDYYYNALTIIKPRSALRCPYQWDA